MLAANSPEPDRADLQSVQAMLSAQKTFLHYRFCLFIEPFKEINYASKIILVFEAPYSAIFSRKEIRCLLFLK